MKPSKRIAIVTDADTLAFAARLVSPFVRADVRRFAGSHRNEAMTWRAAGNP